MSEIPCKTGDSVRQLIWTFDTSKFKMAPNSIKRE